MTRAAGLAAVAALALAACASAPDDTDSTAGGESSAATVDFKGCMVSDAGGFEDKSFNQSGAEGLDRAASELGIEEVKVESTSETDFAPNIDALIQQDCDLIIGVGFLLEDPIQAAAEANPDINFALVDSSFSAPDFSPVTLENGKPLLFNTQEAAFLAGYVAAGTSTSGVVATFGGIQLPSVSIFMDGFSDGITQYNTDAGAAVTLLGWDKEAQTGSFTGDFDNQANGQNLANGFIQQGADVIMPVAGPVGLGAATAAKAVPGTMFIGVDADWFETAPDFSDIVLTSVMKGIGSAVFDTVQQAVDGEFSSEPYVGTLENEGVSLAPFHDFESTVPAELVTKVDELKASIISGDLVVDSPSSN
ncbi:BMP family ABC transporter substrate-binding protein [Pengzhenrongella sicca]|uniref:BMP family ABC transporter substrate-binding protein n=1 Tax=Pengzhenrongella sicca TaxID=2819238 RepID=A0A8A4ZHN8_9MICO|nr:BMP family ABC transporter substrate-binding protein [Pengzhenrongella sicca]QTE31572.1 BMP family ABC transporter substrate-binding protein [Pengzhenrongella sicca]